ncbi:MAG: nucleotidyltransferase domain-containing protein, partial [Pseudonocardiales bacterium]|nr:nucleotidyltransferase domain-containing protein [Pseudonocardiales bacterium]
MTPDELAVELGPSAAAGELRLLVLHGSRARGDHGPESDWDFGVLTNGEIDLADLVSALTLLLGTDAVDVVDLRRACALLRFRAARDGIPIVERPDGEFLQFQLEAVRF